MIDIPAVVSGLVSLIDLHELIVHLHGFGVFIVIEGARTILLVVAIVVVAGGIVFLIVEVAYRLFLRLFRFEEAQRILGRGELFGCVGGRVGHSRGGDVSSESHVPRELENAPLVLAAVHE